MSHQKGVASVTLSTGARIWAVWKKRVEKKERLDQSYVWALIEYVFCAENFVHHSGKCARQADFECQCHFPHVVPDVGLWYGVRLDEIMHFLRETHDGMVYALWEWNNHSISSHRQGFSPIAPIKLSARSLGN